MRILQPGRNCGGIASADRAAFLVDGDAYFRAVLDAFAVARHSIFVVGWDVDSRLPLGRDGGGRPTRLGALLSRLVEERPELDVYVLGWDYAPVYVFEREAFPRIKFGSMTPDRVHFALDDSHPPGGSHHQKVVVVDDRIAFAGGLDLCDVRWDTPEHRVDDPRRVDLSGKIYRPHHDVQMVVGGAAAAALGEVARERWHIATGRHAKPTRTADADDPWPLPTDVENVEIAVVRTIPRWGARSEEIRECERLWLDCIRAARRTIFIENPYFTSTSAAHALAERLREPEGPEVVIVMPQEGCGWMEDLTMGVLRDRVLCTIYEADEHDRLCIVSPYVPGAGEADLPVSLNLHSKVCIVDDELLRIGSSNLTNRSMSLDTECDLAFEANGSATATAAIIGLRNRLLAEHLAVQPETVQAAIDATGSTARAIAQLRGGDRTLVTYSPCTSELADSILPDGTIVDPSQPLTMERLAKWLFRREVEEARTASSGPARTASSGPAPAANRDDRGSVDPEVPRSPRRTA